MVIFICLNCLYSKKYLKINVFTTLMLSEDTKTLEGNKYNKFYKKPFIINKILNL